MSHLSAEACTQRLAAGRGPACSTNRCRPTQHERSGSVPACYKLPTAGSCLSFWSTVCKTLRLRPMLSDSCLSILSVTLVYCGQTVGWIKMPLDREVGLGPGDIMLDGDSAPPSKKKRATTAPPPIFDPCLLWSSG